jgi:AcrR family transcriptional regulator
VTSIESGWDRRRSLLLNKYEMVAWQLFAEEGFRDVTVDEIAEIAEVSARTMFRYFPTKEEFLLGYPRRSASEFAERVAKLELCQAPIRAVWELIRDYYLNDPPSVKILKLWRRAATDAPEIHARVRGERMHSLTDAIGAYIAASLGADLSKDAQPRLLAGMIVGVESAIVEMWGRSNASLPEILGTAEQAIAGLGAFTAVR